MTQREGIEIDYCPECRGVWLDRGELDKIIERSATWSSGGGSSDRDEREPEPRGRDDREYRDDRDDRDRRGGRDDRPPAGKKKKGSFVGELFESFGDFGP